MRDRKEDAGYGHREFWKKSFVDDDKDQDVTWDFVAYWFWRMELPFLTKLLSTFVCSALQIYVDIKKGIFCKSNR